MIPEEIIGFEWGKGNIDKNWISHQVINSEAEEIFFNKPLVVTITQSIAVEPRYIAFGITDNGRKLIVVYTIRNKNIRVISTRDMSKKEERLMMAKLNKIPNFANEDQERTFWAEHDATEYVNLANSKRDYSQI